DFADLHGMHGEVVRCQEEEFFAIAAPGGISAEVGRDLPLSRGLGEGRDVNLRLPRFVGSVGDPAPVRRDAEGEAGKQGARNIEDLERFPATVGRNRTYRRAFSGHPDIDDVLPIGTELRRVRIGVRLDRYLASGAGSAGIQDLKAVAVAG